MYLATEVAISTINAARHQRLTEEFVPFLAIYYYLSQFIDCPSGDSSIAATVVQRRQLKSPPTDQLSLAAFEVDLALSGRVRVAHGLVHVCESAIQWRIKK